MDDAAYAEGGLDVVPLLGEVARPYSTLATDGAVLASVGG